MFSLEKRQRVVKANTVIPAIHGIIKKRWVGGCHACTVLIWITIYKEFIQ